MDWKDQIEVNEEVLVGKPVIKGTRLSVEHVINLFASGWTEQQILDNYPRLTNDLQAIFIYIQEGLKDGLMFNKPLRSA
ncbi:DUF433 domain-containing protein [uncultured Sunxiuqinia sp.]|uniref:DUF433 domain-containing protein n=1 Tax=uncultured Sunxiuqinia sp. TaxID=1573825 RepID=UPI0030D6F735